MGCSTEDHRLIKITKTIDWLSLSNRLAKFYSPDNGRPTKPSQAKIGVLILKHLYRLSDVDLVDLLKQIFISNFSVAKAIKFLEEAKQFEAKTYRTYKNSPASLSPISKD